MVLEMQGLCHQQCGDYAGSFCEGLPGFKEGVLTVAHVTARSSWGVGPKLGVQRTQNVAFLGL